jgi:pimeloyl-ACP methyl ester carboxylesterase
MSESAYAAFASREPDQAFGWLEEDPGHREVLLTQLGEQAYQEYVALAGDRRAAPDLAIGHPVNLLFIPGVMGSSLESETLGGIWWLDLTNLGRLNDLALAPDGHSDATADYRVRALTTDHRYSGFLTAALGRNDFGHDRHAFDWRRSLTLEATALRDHVQRIREASGGLRVHLVAHSMGGLLVRTALLLHDDLWDSVGRIVFLATPHYGAPAIAGYLKNHFWGWDKLVVLGQFLSRETFRSMRGPLGLLPAPADVYPGASPGDHPCANFDLYDADAWKLDLSDGERGRLQTVLNDTAQLHRDLHAWHGTLAQERRDRMCEIAGVGYKTLFRLEFHKTFLWQHTKKVTDRTLGDPHRDGDGRVPVASAALKRIGDVRYVRAVHGGLPNVPAVYEDTFRWLNEQPLELPTSPAGAMADHLDAAGPTVSRTPALDGSDRVVDSDPGYWDLETDPAAVAAMRARVEAGACPEFMNVGLL